MENEEIMTVNEDVALENNEGENTSAGAVAGGLALIGLAGYGAFKLVTGVAIPTGKSLFGKAKKAFAKKDNNAVEVDFTDEPEN